MPEIRLDRTRVVTVIGELIAAGMAQHVGMCLDAEIGRGFCSPNIMDKRAVSWQPSKMAVLAWRDIVSNADLLMYLRTRCAFCNLLICLNN